MLADLVDGLTRREPAHRRLAATTSHRFGPEISGLAEAVRDGDADRALDLLRAGGAHVELLDPDDPAILAALRDRLVAPRRCACARPRPRRTPPRGDRGARRAPPAVRPPRRAVGRRPLEPRWSSAVLAEHTGLPIGGGWGQEWYAGRPLLLTSNDYGLDLFNGDTGVVVADGDGVRAAIAVPGGPSRPRHLAAHRRRDHARDDGAQEPGQPGRRGHGAAPARRLAACSRASSSTPR